MRTSPAGLGFFRHLFAFVRIVQALAGCFTEEEESVYRRGKNSKPHTTAKNASVADYMKATGFEAVLGYLYLTGDMERALYLVKKGIQLTGLPSRFGAFSPVPVPRLTFRPSPVLRCPRGFFRADACKKEAKKHDTIIRYVTRERLDQMSGTGKHQGVIAMAAAYEYATVQDILQAAKAKQEPPFVWGLRPPCRTSPSPAALRPRPRFR